MPLFTLAVVKIASPSLLFITSHPAEEMLNRLIFNHFKSINQEHNKNIVDTTTIK